jgi:flagellar biosynthesis GTPase FlhF
MLLHPTTCSSASGNLGSHLRDVRLRVVCVKAVIMVKVQVRGNGRNGQHRAEFWEHGRIHKSSNQDTRELAEAIKDRLDAAATHEERLEILAEVQAQKGEAVAQEALKATRAAEAAATAEEEARHSDSEAVRPGARLLQGLLGFFICFSYKKLF